MELGDSSDELEMNLEMNLGKMNLGTVHAKICPYGSYGINGAFCLSPARHPNAFSYAPNHPGTNHAA
jgi:hypothetical protein